MIFAAQSKEAVAVRAVLKHVQSVRASMLGGLWAAVVLLVVNGAIAYLGLRLQSLRHWMEGIPTLLVLHGEMIPQHLRREHLDEEMLLAALHEHGISKIKDVEMVVRSNIHSGDCTTCCREHHCGPVCDCSPDGTTCTCDYYIIK